MIKDNKFFIENIKNLVIFGYHENLKEIFDFTKKIRIKKLFYYQYKHSKPNTILKIVKE